jgi:outer membrane protein assembly factor BamA
VDTYSPSFTAIEGDLRIYKHFGRGFSLSMRNASGFSTGQNPKTYYMGGCDNWFYPKTAKDDVYSVNDMYFSKMILPLRGYDYFEFDGHYYSIFNMDFRYPFVQYLKLGFPPVTLGGINGAIFWDMGFVEEDSFESIRLFKNGRMNDLKAGMGFSFRMGISYFVLNYDIAWSTDLKSSSKKPGQYFSIGAEF